MHKSSPITPGEILLEDYLKPMGISQNGLARSLGVSPRTVNEIVLGHRGITPEMSLRLGKFFVQSDDFWFSIQTTCDFYNLRKIAPTITSRVKVRTSCT
jgi:addiction module HigA family antidote